MMRVGPGHLLSWLPSRENLTFAASLAAIYALRNSGWVGAAVAFFFSQEKVVRFLGTSPSTAKAHGLAMAIVPAKQPPDPLICKITQNQLKDPSTIFRVGVQGANGVPFHDTFDIYAFFVAALFQPTPQLINPNNRQPLTEKEIETLFRFFGILRKEDFEVFWQGAKEVKCQVDDVEYNPFLDFLEDNAENNRVLATYRLAIFLKVKPEFRAILTQYMEEPSFEEPQPNDVGA